MKDFTRHFGGKTTKDLEARYARSGQWNNGKFQNLEETTMSINFQSLPKLLYKQFCEKEGREPRSKLPITPFDKDSFERNSSTSKFIWYGHSVVLMRMNNQTLLIDPMLGDNASPIAPFATKRFSDNTLDLIDDFPDIDLLLLTHDHYDHLDLKSIQKLKSRVRKFYVALGVGRHLIKWGVPQELITEFDWWDYHNFEGIDITFTPTRHFSGRGISDRAKSLWGGWVFKTQAENIWFSGDGGYGKHFSHIGEQLGPFDFAFMECGQYNENWHHIHMYPEESVRAALDGMAKKVMAVHWAGFSLAQHSWTDPIERFVAECQKSNLRCLAPPLGKQFSSEDEADGVKWWNQ
jgi:L-ascorbate metabolism protein UlaG (beta-lactamase superfamily)